MCGIAGINSFARILNGDDRAACRNMLEALKHRGPNAEGFYAGSEIILGHRRLSIIDLSGSAAQPMSNEEGTIWLVYNGEIYNFGELRDELTAKGHRFKSKTDSEVIVHLYEDFGTECLTYLHGMFAFGLWDSKKKQLFLARDRMGIKPLYYFNHQSSLIFASEARAIRQSELFSFEQNSEAAVQFLQFGSIPEPLTAFKDIFSLPAGHYLIANQSGMSIHPYWDLAEILNRHEPERLDSGELREILTQTVKRHLVSDVPVGILLSGGIDSSSLVALAHQAKKPLHTLTIGFRESDLDESAHARLISQEFRTQHHERSLDAETVLTSLDDFFEAMDQPTVDGLNTYWVSRFAKEEGLSVLLSGLGGDEVFGGYSHFKYADRMFSFLPLLKQMPKTMSSWLIRNLMRYGKSLGFSGAARFSFLKEPTPSSGYRVYRGVFPSERIHALLPDHSGFFPAPLMETNLKSNFDLAVYLEFNRYLKNQLLRDTDVMSMSQSIEIRVPFLDDLFVTEWLQRSLQNRFDRKVSKRLLKEALEQDLSSEVRRRPKKGFIFPMEHWLRSSLKPYVEQFLLDDQSMFGHPLNQTEVQNLWQDFLTGEIHWSLPWSLFVLKRWQSGIKDAVSKQS